MELVDADNWPVFFVGPREAPPALDLDTIEAEHGSRFVGWGDSARQHPVYVCTTCRAPYPCNTLRLVAELRQLRAAFVELADFVKLPVPFGAYGTWRSLGTEEAAAAMDEWDRRRLAARKLIARVRSL